MAARLGNILYWLGIVLAAIALLEALLDAFGSSQSGHTSADVRLAPDFVRLTPESGCKTRWTISAAFDP